MSELLRQQQKIRERREALYGKPKVVNVLKPKIVYVATEPEPESEPEPPIEPDPEPEIEIRLTPFQFIKKMSSQTKFRYEEIVGPRRSVELVRERHRIIFEVKENYPSLSFPQIGRLFNRDHTTILHAVRTYETRSLSVSSDLELEDKIRSYVIFLCGEYGITYAELRKCETHKKNISKYVNIFFKVTEKFEDWNMRICSIVFNRSDTCLRSWIVAYKKYGEKE